MNSPERRSRLLPLFPQLRTCGGKGCMAVQGRFCCKSLFEVSNENS